MTASVLVAVAVHLAVLFDSCPPLVIVAKEIVVENGKMSFKGHGSGVVVDPRGYVVTCLHCVGRRDEVAAGFRLGLPLPATVVHRQPEDDLALLKIEDGGRWRYPFLRPSSDLPRVTDRVHVWGHPHEFPFTLSSGTVTAINRGLKMPDGDPLSGLIQVDAAINSGCSGGALLNAKGELLGIPVAIREGAQGIGFAVPARAVRRLMENLPPVED